MNRLAVYMRRGNAGRGRHRDRGALFAFGLHKPVEHIRLAGSGRSGEERAGAGKHNLKGFALLHALYNRAVTLRCTAVT